MHRLRAIGVWVGWPLLGGLAVLGAVLLIAGLVTVVEDFFTGSRSAGVASAGASLVVAGATIGLVAGSAVAARYFHGQVLETRRAGHAALRPVLAFDGMTAGSLRVRPGEDEEICVRVMNVGPGPALDVRVVGWDRHNCDGASLDGDGESLDSAAPTHEGGPEVLGSGESKEVVLRASKARRRQEPRASGPLHLRVTYSDVFGNEFALPPAGDAPFRARFERLPV